MISKIKTIVVIVVAVILISLGIAVTIQYNKIKELTENYKISTANEKALLLKSEEVNGKYRALQLSFDQMSYVKDSLFDKLLETKNQLKLKNSQVKQLQYLSSIAKTTDTVKITDTIFVENFCLDTTLQDNWHKTNLKLCYPNQIEASSEFHSEKQIITSIRKETIKPPCKTWIGRLFQKKHKVLTVDVIESNPYIETKEYKHIEIIK